MLHQYYQFPSKLVSMEEKRYKEITGTSKDRRYSERQGVDLAIKF
jgi:hypothetical protein